MTAVKDLDYFFTVDGTCYLTSGHAHPVAGVIACPVYWPDPAGDRWHPTRGRYRKQVREFCPDWLAAHPEYRSEVPPRNRCVIPREQIVEVCRPRDAFWRFLEEEPATLWRRVAETLMDVGEVPAEAMGVFGSRLVGLDRDADGSQVKDVDFVVSGQRHYRTLRDRFDRVLTSLGATGISPEHRRYHADKFGAQFVPGVNSFELTLANKWSSIQLAPGLLATVRFSYGDGEAPPLPEEPVLSHDAAITGLVTDDAGANFLPRSFTVTAPNGYAFEVVTWFWGFQAAVKNGDRVVVTGNLHADAVTVTLDAATHGIQIVP